jgi:hypothetical protein
LLTILPSASAAAGKAVIGITAAAAAVGSRDVVAAAVAAFEALSLFRAAVFDEFVALFVRDRLSRVMASRGAAFRGAVLRNVPLRCAAFRFRSAAFFEVVLD